MPTNKSRDPLLYIQQPELRFPEAEMQQTYVVRKAELEEKNSVVKSLENESESDNNSLIQAQSVKNKEEETKEKSLSKPVKDEGGVLSDIQKEDLHSAAIQDAIQQYHKQSQDDDPSSNPKRKKQSYSFNRVKSFKEMNTIERLNYLVHFPKLLPPVPCVFVTKSRSVKGFLMNKEEDSIEVKQFNDQMIQISIGELIEVKMIGLK